MEILPTAGLIGILVIVLAGPFLVRRIEQNLEIFLFACGVAALTIAGFVSIEGVATGWSTGIVLEALTAPVLIGRMFGIPVGIVQIVLLVGFLIYLGHRVLERGIQRVVDAVPLGALSFLLVVGLGLLSSVISAILAAILLIEILCALPLPKEPKIRLAVVACFAIGLGAALTPLGEPLSTIVVSKLSGPPYQRRLRLPRPDARDLISCRGSSRSASSPSAWSGARRCRKADPSSAGWSGALSQRSPSGPHGSTSSSWPSSSSARGSNP